MTNYIKTVDNMTIVMIRLSHHKGGAVVKAETIIAKLRGLRAEKNVDLGTVGEAIKVHRTTLSVYESGTRKMPLPVLLDLLDYYQVPAHIFFKNIYDNSLEKR